MYFRPDKPIWQRVTIGLCMIYPAHHEKYPQRNNSINSTSGTYRSTRPIVRIPKLLLSPVDNRWRVQTPSNVPIERSQRHLSKPPFSLRVSPPCFGQKRLRTARPSGCYIERHKIRYHADRAQNKKTALLKVSAHL